MSKSGITRRIDELGRLVIPKEIRKNLKIKDNDQLEINVINDKIVLSKYDILKKDRIIHLMLVSLRKSLNKNIVFTSREKIIDSCLVDKEKNFDICMHNDLITIIEKREELIEKNSKIQLNSHIYMKSFFVNPLIINGDLYGSLIIYHSSEISNKDIDTIKFAKMFLENYLE